MILNSKSTCHTCKYEDPAADFVYIPRMSQLDYYGQDPLNNLPHRGGLAGWGITMIIFGSLSALMALVAVGSAIVFSMGIVPNAQGQSPVTMLVGGGVYVVAAVVLIWLGIGSRQGKRWVRPLVIAGASMTAVSGLASLTPLIIGTISLARHPSTRPAAPGLPPYFEVMILACGGVFVLLLTEVLPIIMLWFYGRKSVQDTLDQTDPNPRWTDRCPLPVLTWCLACALLGFGLMFAAVKGVFPFYNAVLVGLPAYITTAALGIMLLCGGILCFRMNPIGLVLSLIVSLILASSYGTFVFLGNTQVYLDMMFAHMPKASRDMAERMGTNPALAPAVIHIISVGYVLYLWRYFKAPTPTPAVA
jgi:hypothetical protein